MDGTSAIPIRQFRVRRRCLQAHDLLQTERLNLVIEVPDIRFICGSRRTAYDDYAEGSPQTFSKYCRSFQKCRMVLYRCEPTHTENNRWLFWANTIRRKKIAIDPLSHND